MYVKTVIDFALDKKISSVVTNVKLYRKYVLKSNPLRLQLKVESQM
jgi:hypothetical protein